MTHLANVVIDRIEETAFTRFAAAARDGDASELTPYLALTYTEPDYAASHAQT